MKPVPHFLVANLRISEQTTKFYLSFFTFDLPNDTNTSPTLTDIFLQTSNINHHTYSRLIRPRLLIEHFNPMEIKRMILSI